MNDKLNIKELSKDNYEATVTIGETSFTAKGNTPCMALLRAAVVAQNYEAKKFNAAQPPKEKGGPMPDHRYPFVIMSSAAVLTILELENAVRVGAQQLALARDDFAEMKEFLMNLNSGANL